MITIPARFLSLLLKDDTMFSMQLGDIKTISEECARQQSGELSVYQLASAICFAQSAMTPDKPLTVINIRILGNFVEPKVNARGFRKLPVFIDGRMAGVNPDNIETALEALCEAYNDKRIGCADLYQEFETIHPFADGNGRVGFVLYNLFNYGASGRPLLPAPHYIKS